MRRPVARLARPDRRPNLLEVLAAVIADPTAAEERLEPLDDAAAAELIDAARRHGVEAWLAGHAPATPSWRELAAQRGRFVAARARARADLRRVGAVLDPLGCAWVAVKGQALAEDVYPRPHLRFGVDIDVLVEPARFAAATDALQHHGWTLLDQNWPLLAANAPGELKLRSPTGTLLDLHWHLLNTAELRRSFRMDPVPMLARRRTLASGLPVLDQADQLVHLGTHGALSGATRLQWLADAGLAARRIADWDEVAGRARAAGAGSALALVLWRARRWLRTPAPSAAIRASGAGPDLHALCRLVDRVSPLSPAPDRPSLAGSFARSIRGTSRTTVAEAARHGLAWARSGARRDHRQWPVTDDADPRSALYPVADEAARQRYFALVGER